MKSKPSKLSKYWQVHRNVYSAEVPYTYFTLQCNGKPDRPCNKFHATRTDAFIKYLVNNFVRYKMVISATC